MACKGLCIRLPKTSCCGNGNSYQHSRGWCTICQRYVVVPVGITCPCCNRLVRSKPRSSKQRMRIECKRY